MVPWYVTTAAVPATLTAMIVVEIVMLKLKFKHMPTTMINAVIDAIGAVLRACGEVWATIGSIFTIIEWSLIATAFSNYWNVFVRVMCVAAEFHNGYAKRAAKYTSPTVVRVGNGLMIVGASWVAGYYFPQASAPHVWVGHMSAILAVFLMAVYRIYTAVVEDYLLERKARRK